MTVMYPSSKRVAIPYPTSPLAAQITKQVLWSGLYNHLNLATEARHCIGIMPLPNGFTASPVFSEARLDLNETLL